MDDFDERELLTRCRAGDEAAFGTLIDRYKDRVLALVARTITEKGRADELAQEVFLRVYRGLPYFRGEARLSTWIYRITANLCLQERASTVREISLDDTEDGTRPRIEPGVVDTAFTDLELRDRIEKAIARLPGNYRLLIAAHYLKGVPYEDLAEALNVPLGTIKTQLHRAKRHLRRLLQTELR